MKKWNLAIVILLVVIAGTISFFAGMKYQQHRRPAFFRQFGAGQGIRSGEGQVNRFGFRQVQGEIITKDEKSITVKLQDGSSKIVFISENTQINKANKAKREDLKSGEKVAIFGQENSDGSITAQNIQINPFFRLSPAQ